MRTDLGAQRGQLGLGGAGPLPTQVDEFDLGRQPARDLLRRAGQACSGSRSVCRERPEYAAVRDDRADDRGANLARRIRATDHF